MALLMETGLEPKTKDEIVDLEAISALKESTAIELKDKGNEYVKMGKKHYSDAIDCYTRAINQTALGDLEHSILYSNRAHVNLLLGNYRRALQDAEEASKLSPTNVKTLYRAAKASLFLNFLDGAKVYCEKGLQQSPANEELKTLLKQIHIKKTEQECREAGISKTVATAESLISLLEDRRLKMGRAIYQELTGIKKPILDQSNMLHWPVVLLYPEVMSSDIIEDFCETDMFSVHLDMMFSESSPPLPWDTGNEYTRDSLELYYEAGSGVCLSKKEVLHYLLEGTVASHLENLGSEETSAVGHTSAANGNGSKWVQVDERKTLHDILKGPDFIIPGIPDERYSKYIGKMAIVPMTFGRHVPIISDKYVDKDFGTGVLKISPGHDHNDYLLARKLGLPILNIMNKDGTLNEVAGLYCGLDRFEARKKLWHDLEETGLAVKKEAYTLRVPRSQRGGEIIEPLVSKQWFVTMEPLAENALRAVEKGELTILPERFEKIYNHWLSNIKDWCISRQLWWGHRIPVWYVVDKDPEGEYIIARSEEEALRKAREKHGKNVEIYQDPDVLDTWFSSALWPFSTLGWPDVSAKDFKDFYPTSVLETGHDILFFWVARMVMMGIEFTGKVPFSIVYLHGLIRDSQGRKMSKTLGNVIDPLDTIKEYGTDALRFTLSLGTAGQDLNLSTERLTSNKAFTNKLWNAGKFVLQNLPARSDLSAWKAIQDFEFDIEKAVFNLPLPECWVVSNLHMLIDAVTISYDKLFFGDVAREIYDFFWADFADWYIEASKARLYNSEADSVATTSQAVLLYVFENILKLLHPFMPFVTEELWQSLPYRKEALIVTAWPSTSLPRVHESVKKFENLQALTRAIRNARAEYSVEPRRRIPASIVANSEVIKYISEEKEVLALLTRLDLHNISFTESPPGDANQSVHLVASEGLEAYLPLAAMVDISAEVQRLSKRLAKMQTEYDGLVARLNSPSFVEKAPEDVVRGVQQKVAEAEEKLTLTRNQLSFLQSTDLIAK